MIEFLCEKLMAWCEKRGRVLRITGTAGPQDVYLIRYYVIRSKWFNVFIHQFLRSDRDDMHDHPWHFMTYLVRGAYTERKWDAEKRRVRTTRRAFYRHSSDGREISLNRLVLRKATDQHQVIVDRELKLHEKNQAALTLFVSGPTIREWGFVRVVPLEGTELAAAKLEKTMFAPNLYVKYIKRVWVPWREYLGLPSDAPGRG